MYQPSQETREPMCAQNGIGVMAVKSEEHVHLEIERLSGTMMAGLLNQRVKCHLAAVKTLR